MPVHLLRDADIKAISLVGKGANRKRFFLFKSGEGEETSELGHGRLLKAADWSAVYCVVAEPGWHEDAGMSEDQSIEDRWADEDEIRKAAHRFMRNKGLVTKMHEGMEPYGEIVENAVAPVDFEVNGETIRKGSWYIAIFPTQEGKEAIDKGEFSGVSIEGHAVRELVEKGDGPETLEVVETSLAKVKGSTNDPGTVGNVEKGILRKIAEKVGLSPEEIAEVEKAERPTLPAALSTFGSDIAKAYFEEDAGAAIAKACGDFEAAALALCESVPVEKAERAEALGVELDSEGSTNLPGTKDGEMSLSDKERQEFEDLKKKVAELDPDKIAGAFAQNLAKALGAKVEDETPTAESIAKQVKDLKGVEDEAEIAKRVEKIEADIAKLAEGESSQEDSSGEPSEPDAEAVKKAFESEGVDPALVGVLG